MTTPAAKQQKDDQEFQDKIQKYRSYYDAAVTGHREERESYFTLLERSYVKSGENLISNYECYAIPFRWGTGLYANLRMIPVDLKSEQYAAAKTFTHIATKQSAGGVESFLRVPEIIDNSTGPDNDPSASGS